MTDKRRHPLVMMNVFSININRCVKVIYLSFFYTLDLQFVNFTHYSVNLQLNLLRYTVNFYTFYTQNQDITLKHLNVHFNVIEFSVMLRI